MATNDYVANYDKDPFYLVIREGDFMFCRHLGGIPTPALIDACNDGKGHEAWRTVDGIWRLRDDVYDAENKPADVTYRRVMVGRNPRRA